MLRLLDKRWWDETSEEERVRQVIEWRPYDRTESKERKAHKQFKSNPFASSPIRPRTRWELDAYRSARLATFFKQDLGRLHTLLQQNLLPETAPVLPNSTHIHYNELLSALQTIEKAIVETRLSSPASSSFAAATSASSSLHGSALAGPCTPPPLLVFRVSLYNILLLSGIGFVGSTEHETKSATTKAQLCVLRSSICQASSRPFGMCGLI